jgi:hypothetical protein
MRRAPDVLGCGEEITNGSDQPVSSRGFDLKQEARWRADIQSLVFPIGDHAASCAVHRGAFRTLLGAEPTREACLTYFAKFEEAFLAAALLKIACKGIPAGTNLHLTSRDIARKLLESKQIERGEQ